MAEHFPDPTEPVVILAIRRYVNKVKSNRCESEPWTRLIILDSNIKYQLEQSKYVIDFKILTRMPEKNQNNLVCFSNREGGHELQNML